MTIEYQICYEAVGKRLHLRPGVVRCRNQTIADEVGYIKLDNSEPADLTAFQIAVSTPIKVSYVNTEQTTLIGARVPLRVPQKVEIQNVEKSLPSSCIITPVQDVIEKTYTTEPHTSMTRY